MGTQHCGHHGQYDVKHQDSATEALAYQTKLRIQETLEASHTAHSRAISRRLHRTQTRIIQHIAAPSGSHLIVYTRYEQHHSPIIVFW